MTCAEAERLLSDLLAGDVEEGRAAALQGHLEGCAVCRERAAALARQHRALAELAGEEASPAILQRLRTRLAGGPAVAPAAQRSRRAWRWSLRTPRPAALPALAAAGALGALLVFMALLPSRPPCLETRPTPDAPSAEAIPAPETGPPAPSPAPPAAPPKEESPRMEDLRRRAEEELAPIRDRFHTARTPDRSPPEGETEKPIPALPEIPRPATAAALARLDSIRGNVQLDEETAARAAQDLLPGQGLRTWGPGSLAVLSFPDGTRLELRGDTAVREIALDRGKKVVLERGDLLAEVPRQPPGEPMVFHTPQGTATVLGTTLRLAVEPGETGSTRLEVFAGRVRLRNLSGKSVDVAGGHYAVAAVSASLEVRPLIPDTPAAAALAASGTITIKFGLENAKVPKGVLVDSGKEYDPKRGYGWKGPIGEMPGAWFQGRRMPNRQAVGGGDPARDPLLGSFLAAGWADHIETWVMPVPNGRYLVAIGVGDLGAYPQGPHHVKIEGRQVLNAVVTRAGVIIRGEAIVEVADGELTMEVGGCGRDLDGTSDTVLCFLIVKRVAR